MERKQSAEPVARAGPAVPERGATQQPADERNEFGRRLMAAREAAGLSQARLAERIAISRSALARLERGGSPSIETLRRLADALAISFTISPGSGLVIQAQQQAPSLANLRARREELLRIAASHGASNLRVFGSVARGNARPDSDVDFLVDLEPKRTLFDLGGLAVDLEEALGRRVDVVEVTSGSRFVERVQRDAVPL